LWRKYKKICPVAKLYLFDLSGYGNTPLDITRDDVFLIAGWSDKIFDILSAIDKGNDALQEIKKIVI
jgi:60 kDa SS-A/Ro ribonucleoprotein